MKYIYLNPGASRSEYIVMGSMEASTEMQFHDLWASGFEAKVKKNITDKFGLNV